jgi:hypothetical protein
MVGKRIIRSRKRMTSRGLKSGLDLTTNLDTGTHRRRVGECHAGAARLRGAEGANHALKTTYWTLAHAITSWSLITRDVSSTA